MALLNQNGSTTQAKQARVSTNIRAGMLASLSALQSMWSSTFNTVWQNQAGLTPQQVCDALGTDAGELFTRSAAMQAFINAQVTGTPLEPITVNAPYSYTTNADGSVTIGSAV